MHKSQMFLKVRFYFVVKLNTIIIFKTVVNLTLGMIVRCIQRLNETCKDVSNAARVIGDRKLCEKMKEASTLIKRDIVFAASLYTI